MKKYIPLVLLLCLFVSVKGQSVKKKVSVTPPDLASYVDPYIGTGLHGHVFLGANVPFGAVQLGAVNMSKGWDWCSGYHYSDSILIGFSQMHLSGTGIGDLGDMHHNPAKNVLHVKHTLDAVAARAGKSLEAAAGLLSQAQARLLEARS